MRMRRAQVGPFLFGVLISAVPAPVFAAQNASRNVTDEVGRAILGPAEVKRVRTV